MDEINILLTGCIPRQELLVEERKKYGKEVLSYYYAFSALKPVINNADFTLGSLSTEYSYPNVFIRELKTAGFDYLALGVGEDDNDKAKKIYRLLDKNEIAHPEGSKVGTSIVDIKGIKIGIISCTFNDEYRDLGQLSEVYERNEELIKQHVDFKICYVSWHFSIHESMVVDDRQRVVAKALTNMGIDYIVGTGPRHLMRYEELKGNWNQRSSVVYSLGNLLYCSKIFNWNTSAVINLKVKKDEYGKVSISDSYLPCYTWTILGHHRRRVQFLNNRTYRKDSTNNLVEWRKHYVSQSLGDSIPLCRDFDVDDVDVDVDDRNEPESLNGLVEEFALERISDVSVLQNKILDSYRLTDEFRETYSKMLYSNNRYILRIRGAEHFIRINYPEIIEMDDVKSIITDLIYTRDVLGFNMREYFAFHFMEKSIQERTGYISDSYKVNYYRRLNTDVDENYQLNNKWTCYERMKDLFGREIINITDKTQYDHFVRFVEKHGRFIIKPVFSDQGKGIRIIDINDYDDKKDLFYDLYEKAGPFVCEELIKSKKYLERLHPQSCNSLRVFSHNDNNDIKIICAWLKAGTGNSVVDNGGAGGVAAGINIEKGVVDYDAGDETGKKNKRHPDTGIAFKGFQIEEWELLKKMVYDASSRFPKVKIIAWDVAHGVNGWQIIEGNPMGQMWIYQLSTGKGMRKEWEESIGWQNI